MLRRDPHNTWENPCVEAESCTLHDWAFSQLHCSHVLSHSFCQRAVAPMDSWPSVGPYPSTKRELPGLREWESQSSLLMWSNLVGACAEEALASGFESGLGFTWLCCPASRATSGSAVMYISWHQGS